MPVLRCYLMFTIPALLFAGEFWQDKKPSDWTEKDVKRLLRRSQ